MNARAPTLSQLLAALQVQQAASSRSEHMEADVAQRAGLIRAADQAAFIKPGVRISPFSVTEAFGDTLESGELLARGPLVLMFFRFAGCPACNIALPYYYRHLWPQLKTLGAQVLALSPQIPERLIGIKLRLGMDFLVGCDRDNVLARRFGLLYTYGMAAQLAALARGISIGEVTGTGTWELPMPAIVVVDSQGLVRFVEVSPDWLDRTEAEPMIDAVREVLRVRDTRSKPLPRRSASASRSFA